jgi:chromosome segregation ATPase
MGLEEIIEMAEEVGDRDERRRDAFLREFEAYEAGELDAFEETRAALADERDALAELRTELDHEEENIEELVDRTEFLTVDQAVRNRDATLGKLRAHNDHLGEFVEAMDDALERVERNLDALEREGPEAVSADPDLAFERAHEALEAHNTAVEGLDSNMMILNAYLI